MPLRWCALALAVVFLQEPLPAPRGQSRRADPAPAAVSFPALATGIGRPNGLAVDASGAVLIAAPEVGRVFRLGASGDMAVIAAGDMQASVLDHTTSFRPVSVAVDAHGNVYLVDDGDHSVRRIDGRTGRMTTVLDPHRRSADAALLPPPTAGPVRSADGSDGPIHPWGVAVDPAGNLYVSDRALHTVFRIRSSTGRAEPIAGCGLPGYAGDGNPAVQARLDSPQGLAVGAAGVLFVADRGNHCVRRIDTRTGIITTVAGNGFPGSSGDGGKATSAELRDPVAVAVDRSGSLYVADLGNGRVRRVAPQSGIISTPSGLHDVAAEALAVVPRTGALVAGDAIGSRVLRRDKAGVVTRIAGNGSLGYAGDGGRALSAYLARPAGLARDVHGNLYVADAGGHRVRRIDLAAGVISTVAGTGRPGFSGDGGAAVTSTLNAPQGLAFDREGRLVIADTGNHRVRRIAADGSIATVAGSGLDGLAQDGQPAISSDIGRPSAVAVDTQGALIVAQGQYGLVHRIDAAGKLRTIVGSRLHVALRDGAPATSGRIERISAFALSPGGDIFFAEEGPSRIWRVDPQTNVAAVVAGRGLGAPVGAPDMASGVTLSWVRALAADTAGNVYIGQYPDGMRRLDAATGRVAALAADGRGALRPSALLLDDSALYLAEDAGFVKRLETDGRLVAVAGGGPGF